MAYKLSKDYLWKEVGGRVVVLHFESGRYYSLNDSGSIIWKSLLDNQAPQEMIKGLCSEFEVDEATAKKDIDKMTQQFLEKKFLVVC